MGRFDLQCLEVMGDLFGQILADSSCDQFICCTRCELVKLCESRLFKAFDGLWADSCPLLALRVMSYPP